MKSANRRVTSLGLMFSLGAFSLQSCGSRTAAGATGTQRVRQDLYACDGCEVVGERSPQGLSPTVRLAGVDEPGERMMLSGRVLMADGLTPAADVVIYAHQTNSEGLYANGSPETVWSRRHGRLRGWVRTGSDGRYAFDTIKPAPYPNDTIPAHVHLYLQEPGRPPYYIDDVVFDGEFGVDAAYRAAQKLRGGSGIVRLTRDAGVWNGRRDIVLERHPA